MLYDKRWDRTETKPDVFSLESLIAWLEKQDASLHYDYSCVGACLLGQYVRSIDPNSYFWPDAGPLDLYKYVVFGKLHDFADFGDIAFSLPRTFGAALERARSVVSSAQRGEV